MLGGNADGSDAENALTMKIKNINRASQHDCACGSWLRHWEEFSGQRISYCPVFGCLNRDLVGAHVQVAADPEGRWFVYPLCQTHSQSPGELAVSDTYFLVSANKRHTCEKGMSLAEAAWEAFAPAGSMATAAADLKSVPAHLERLHPLEHPLWLSPNF